MRKQFYLPLFFLIFCWSSLHAQHYGLFFPPEVIYENKLNITKSIYASDLDNDNDLDAIVLCWDEIAWYENDGSGNFSSRKFITKYIHDGRDICIADLDGDGFKDIIYASTNSEKVAWFKNNGNGNFSNQNVLASNAGLSKTVEAADLDGDGDQDVVYGTTTNGIIAWFENDSIGNFTSKKIISDSAQASSIKIADNNGDGFPDVVSTAIWDRIVWFQNDGNGNFGNEQVIDSLDYTPKSIYTADLNNDGRIDVLSSGYPGSGFGKIIWHENDGNGNFSENVIDNKRAGRINLADIDNDSLPDIIVGRFWYKNTGAGAFSSKIEITNVHSGSFPADFNNDGHVDLLHKVAYGLGWSENQGNGNFDQYKVIQSSIKELRSMHYEDLDNDGDQDIISGSYADAQVAWHENNGIGGFTKHTIARNESNGVYSVNSFDINGNNYPDVIVSSIGDGKVVWYPNDGTGNFSNYNVIDSTAKGARDVLTADMNNNGLLDVIVVAEWNNHVLLYGNNGNGTFSQPIEITDNLNNLETATIADINADSFKDVVIVVNHELMWYRNDGLGNFISEGIVANGSSAYHKIEDELMAEDLNGDNYPDIVVPNSQGAGYFKNNGNGTFKFQDFGFNHQNFSIVNVEDIDNDGDSDILTDRYCYINDGNGNFPEFYHLFVGHDIELSLKAVDLNNDNYPDLVRGFRGNTKIIWHANKIPTGIKSIDDKSGLYVYPNPTNGKLYLSSKNEKIDHIQIYTVTGKLISKSGRINSREYVSDLTPLPEGVYILQIKIANSRYEKRIIKR
ncbi:MAG: T9SS type A sorting domain-containing protein [Bacteroidales bacterium]|nr:T9SS type A sorting domain-containing protein [Bacteroidales bacterium]